MSEASAPVLSTASCTVLKIGQPSCVVPPLPGVTPPTICVPYSAQALAWNVPSRPVRPCPITRVDLSTRMLMTLSLLSNPCHPERNINLSRSEGNAESKDLYSLAHTWIKPCLPLLLPFPPRLSSSRQQQNSALTVSGSRVPPRRSCPPDAARLATGSESSSPPQPHLSLA